MHYVLQGAFLNILLNTVSDLAIGYLPIIALIWLTMIIQATNTNLTER